MAWRGEGSGDQYDIGRKVALPSHVDHLIKSQPNVPAKLELGTKG